MRKSLFKPQVITESLTKRAPPSPMTLKVPNFPPVRNRSPVSDIDSVGVGLSQGISSGEHFESVSTETLESIELSPTKVTTSQLLSLFERISKTGFPSSVSLGSFRLCVISRGNELPLEKLIHSLEIFASQRVSDHLFFKEIGRLLISKIADLTITQICRVLRAHAAVGCHEAELFNPIYDRLCVVVNRSTLSQLVDILHSVSLVESSTFDCLNIAELCLNRYSLSLRETGSSCSSPLVESRILAAMSRMRLYHGKTLQKMAKKLSTLSSTTSHDTLVTINNYLTSLDVRPHQLLKISPSSCSTLSIPSVFGWSSPVSSPIFPSQLANQPIDDQKAYKYRMVLATSLSLHGDDFLNTLSTYELQKLNKVIDQGSETFREKSQSFFDYRGISLQRQSVSGIFSINIAKVLSKEERASRVLRRK